MLITQSVNLLAYTHARLLFLSAAYSFAAQSIIAACAGLTVVWNVLLAPCTLGEILTMPRMIAAALICAGVVGVGVFGSHVEIERSPNEYLALFTRPAALCYYAGYALWAAVSLGLYWRAPQAVGSFFLCAFGGSLAGNSFTTKAAVELMECGAIDPGCPGSPLTSPLFYAFAGASLTTASLSLFVLAVSLRGHPALYMITVYQGFFVLSGAVSGNVVMDEARDLDRTKVRLYIVSVLVILLGLVVLMRGEHRGARAAVAKPRVAPGRSAPPPSAKRQQGQKCAGKGATTKSMM